MNIDPHFTPDEQPVDVLEVGGATTVTPTFGVPVSSGPAAEDRDSCSRPAEHARPI